MNRIRKSIAVKSIAGIILLLTIFSVIVGKIGYEGFTNAQLSEYADGAFKAAHTTALAVSGVQRGEEITARRAGFLPRIIFMEAIENGDVSWQPTYGILCRT